MPCARRRLGASRTSCSTVAVDFLQGVLGEKGKSQDEVPELLLEINRTCALQVVRPRVPGPLPSPVGGWTLAIGLTAHSICVVGGQAAVTNPTPRPIGRVFQDGSWPFSNGRELETARNIG